MHPRNEIPTSNRQDNYKHDNIVLHSVVLAVTTAAVLIRLYTRCVIKRSFGTDDWLVILSWALSLEFSIVLAYATRWGFGMHIYDIPATDLLQTLKWLTVAQKSYFPLILSIKLCILYGYLRIFKVDRNTKWGIWFGIFACVVFYITTFFVDLFSCKPVEASWNPAIEGDCIDYAALPWATGVFNMVSDFYILVLPLTPIFKMNMALARRLRIMSIFGLGLFTCIASIMRFVVSRQYASDPDQTYVAAKVLHWTVLEINIGLICACANGFPAFFSTKEPRSLGSLVESLLASRNRSQSGDTSPPRSDGSYTGSLHSDGRSSGHGKSQRWKKLSQASKDKLKDQTGDV